MLYSQPQLMCISYRVVDDDQQVIASTELDGEPLEFVLGHGQIVAGLEAFLSDKSVGFSGSVHVEPEQAFGLYYGDAVLQVDANYFGEEMVAVGDEVQCNEEELQGIVFRVTDVQDNQVILDPNHPLAGKTLHYEVVVLDKRAASEEELQKLKGQ